MPDETENANPNTKPMQVFYCQVDTYLATKDYLHKGRCVRLIGVVGKDYRRLGMQEADGGVNTFVLDVDLWTFILKTESRIWNLSAGLRAAAIQQLEEKLPSRLFWVKVTAELSNKGRNYFYPTFSVDMPTFFSVSAIKWVRPQNLPVIPMAAYRLESFLGEQIMPHELRLSTATKPRPEFVAFHVGQGMCSLLHNTHYGVLFDAGAGAPITRKAYLEGKISNELKTIVKDLDKLPYMVLSHFDHDHWRMLAWDVYLSNKIETILVPGVASRMGKALAFFDTKVINKVRRASSFHIPLNDEANIHGRRSLPSTSDSNGECLVCTVTLSGRVGLVPGDYVYARMLTDSNADIQSWAKISYCAVIVPHHGDAASAKSIPNSTTDGIAFFSAGNHKAWQHPTKASLTNHTLAGYKIVSDNEQNQIVARRLL